MHEYQSVWKAAFDEKLTCVREVGNRSDVFTVAIVKAGETVGHLPRKISSILLFVSAKQRRWSLFLQNGGERVCEVHVTGLRHHRQQPCGMHQHPRIIVCNIGDESLGVCDEMPKFLAIWYYISGCHAVI